MEDQLTFPQIIEGLSAPVATITPDGRVDLVSRQLLDYLGMSFEELRKLPMPQPDVLGRNGTYVGLRKYQSRVGAFN